jgi:tripartite-type tricarboxylate transporter receptor subunit TctC
VRALGVTSLKRSSILPDVPSIAEAGFPGYEAVGWWAVVGPRGMPGASLTKINRMIESALVSQDVREKLLRQGAEAAPTTPQALAAYIDKQAATWTRVIKDANIQLK